MKFQAFAKPILHPHKISKDLFAVLSQAQAISRLSNGAFDVTIGHQTRNWREQRKQLQQKNSKEAQAVSQKNVETSYRDLELNPKTKTVTFKKKLSIDLGAIAKGYIADQLMTLIKKQNISSAVVNVGGEMVLGESPPDKKGWKVGMESPELQNIGVVLLSNTALSTSGDSYQFFKLNGIRQAHLLDPQTNKAKSNRLNVTTLAPTAMLADAWATALRVLPTDHGMALVNRQHNIKALFILTRKNLFSQGFPWSQPLT